MNERSIVAREEKLQQAGNDKLLDYIGMMFGEFLSKKQVFCPMCEIWHENNTWCQAPDMDMEVYL